MNPSFLHHCCVVLSHNVHTEYSQCSTKHRGVNTFGRQYTLRHFVRLLQKFAWLMTEVTLEGFWLIFPNRIIMLDCFVREGVNSLSRSCSSQGAFTGQTMMQQVGLNTRIRWKTDAKEINSTVHAQHSALIWWNSHTESVWCPGDTEDPGIKSPTNPLHASQLKQSCPQSTKLLPGDEWWKLLWNVRLPVVPSRLLSEIRGHVTAVTDEHFESRSVAGV